MHLSKLSTFDFDAKNEVIFKKINEIESKTNDLISNLFGVKTNEIDGIKLKKQLSFVSKKDFDTYKNKTEEEFIKLWEEINKLKTIYDEVIKKSKNQSSMEDLESMRDLILQKIEELFVNQNKKYATSFSTLDVLQEQFKKLLELLAIKEEEEKENWLIAKKPINGFSCASCESYIGGDLKNDKNKFIHWNKMPYRERDTSGEKFYRVGNGYSRLLQMINFDNNGNVTLNPFPNSNNNISSNFNNSSIYSNSNENNKSLSRDRINSAKSKKGSKDKSRTLDIFKSKNDGSRTNRKKLPMIKYSMSTDNFGNLNENNNINSFNQNISIGGNNTSFNFQNSKITKVLKKNQFK